MKYTSKEKTFIMVRGIALGFYWELGLTLFKIPLFLFEKTFLNIIYLVIIFTIYFFILKSNSRYGAFLSWLSSIPIAIFIILIYTFSPLNYAINDFAFQNHIIDGETPLPFLYDYTSSIFYLSYHVLTLLTTILAIIFSVPKKKNNEQI